MDASSAVPEVVDNAEVGSCRTELVLDNGSSAETVLEGRGSGTLDPDSKVRLAESKIIRDVSTAPSDELVVT